MPTLKEELKKLLGDKADDSAMSTFLELVTSNKTAFAEAETAGLLENKTKLLGQLDKLKKNQAPEDYDADGYTQYVKDKEEFEKKQKELEDKGLEDKGQWEALKQQLIEGNNTKISDLTTEKDSIITILQGALDHELIENASIKAIEAEKGNSFFLLPHMKGQIQTVNEDGKFSVQVIKDGEPRMDDEGKPFTVGQLVAEMKANDRFAPAFPNIDSGSDKDVNVNGVKGGVNPWKKDTRNVTLQARINRENPTLAKEYKKAAGIVE